MDIRNYFGAKPSAGGSKPSGGGSKPNNGSKSGSDKKPQKDQSGKRKKMAISDSSDEEEPRHTVIKKKPTKMIESDDESDFITKSKAPTPKKPKVMEEKKPQLKEVKAADFFAQAGGGAKKGTDPKVYDKSSKDREHNEKKRKPSGDGGRPKDRERTSHSSPSKKAKTDPEEKCISSSHSQEKKSLSNKLAAFSRDKPTEKESSHQKSKSSSNEGEKSQKDSKKKTPEKSRLEVVTTTPSRETKGSTSAHDTSLNDSTSELPSTPQAEHEEKKKSRQMAYQKFLSRGGAKNPGSKIIPEGTPGCFNGLTFVLTGVYDSLEREEMADIIKRYGGKVTTSVSKNTSYLVKGVEAGQSKVAKADQLGTQQITEDGFLELIMEKRDPKAGGEVKEKENKTPSPDKKSGNRQKDDKKSTPTGKDRNRPAQPDDKCKPVSVKKEVKMEVLKSPNEKKERTNSFRPGSIKIEEEDRPVIKTEESRSTQLTGEVQLWVDKYKPNSCKAIIGQQGDRSNMNKLKIWLRDWNKNHLVGGKPASKPAPWATANDNGAWAKCALLSGPPGVGKTTTSYLVAKELGYDIVEFNASDTRSKRLLQENVSDTLSTTSLSSMLQSKEKVSSKRVLLMDEVDGMAGNEDRGGIAELINLIKSSKVPVIAMCNDRNHQKIRSLANHCFDLRFQRPRVEQIKAAMMSVCFKEKIKIKPDALSELIIGCGQDVRQILHNLSMIRAGDYADKMDVAQAKKEADIAKKTSIKLGPWDVCRKVFSADDHRTMSLFDKSDLYFYDYNLSGLFVQENYLGVTPQAAKGDRKKSMELFSKAADSIAEGDLVERGIRSGMNWSLLPTAAIFSSVLPGEYLSGFLNSQIQFPAWLGKNSRRSKMDRILQELQLHTRLTAGVSKTAFNLDYANPLRDKVVRPLQTLGTDGVDSALETMEKYSLLREDLDGLLEVTQWPNKPDPMKDVDTKTKSAFTRKYNKDGISLPYSVIQNVKKKAKESSEYPDDEELMTEGDGGSSQAAADDEDNEQDSLENDAMIKVKKPSAAGTKAKKGGQKEAESSSGKSTKGGKGKGKK